MNARSSGPVMPSSLAAQSRQRYGLSMEVRYFSPRNSARDSSICSMSSRNFRNMIQVSIGKRPRSLDKPLSFRMMSRADLIRLPSCCAVVSAACDFDFANFCLLLCRIKQRLQIIHRLAKALGTAEQVRDLHHVAVLGNGRHLQDVRQQKLRHSVLGVLVEQIG